MAAVLVTITTPGFHGEPNGAPVANVVPRAAHSITTGAGNSPVPTAMQAGECAIIAVSGDATVKLAAAVGASPDATAAHHWLVGTAIGQSVWAFRAAHSDTRLALTDA